MPSVASESHSVPPLRSQLPSTRTQPDTNSQQPATPFADLLDSAAPQAEPEPPARQARADRSDAADRSAAPKANDNPSPKPANNDAKDSKADAGKSDAPVAKAKDGKAADAGKKAKDGAAAASTDAKGKAKTDTDQSTALDATFVQAATPAAETPVVAVPQQLALAVAADAAKGDGAAEVDAIAAMQAAGQGAAPATAAKPGQAAADKQGDVAAKGAAPADPQAAVPQIEAGKDGQAQGDSDKASNPLHHAAADLLAKFETDPSGHTGGNDAGIAKADVGAVQNAGAVIQANTVTATAAPAAATAAGEAQAAAVPLSNLAVEITSQAHAGKNHFEIRLDPPELGRIDVKLDVDSDGNVSTRLVVERSDTLDLLKRDSASLERALQQSGLKTSDNGLQFSLQQQQNQTGNDGSGQSGTKVIVSDDDLAPLEAMRQGYGRLLGLGGGLDIRV